MKIVGQLRQGERLQRKVRGVLCASVSQEVVKPGPSRLSKEARMHTSPGDGFRHPRVSGVSLSANLVGFCAFYAERVGVQHFRTYGLVVHNSSNRVALRWCICEICCVGIIRIPAESSKDAS